MMWSSISIEHVKSLNLVFSRLAGATLTLNLALVTYLGKQVGQGQVRPIETKVAAIVVYLPISVSCGTFWEWLDTTVGFAQICLPLCLF